MDRTIYLTDGRTVTGEIVHANPNYTAVLSGDYEILVPASLIERVSPCEGEE